MLSGVATTAQSRSRKVMCRCPEGDGAPTPPAIAPLLRYSQPTISSLYVIDFGVDGGQLLFGDVVCFLFLFEVICKKVLLGECDIFTSD